MESLGSCVSRSISRMVRAPILIPLSSRARLATVSWLRLWAAVRLKSLRRKAVSAFICLFDSGMFGLWEVFI